MVRLFERNMVVQVLLIVAVLGLLWAEALMHPQPMPDGEGAVLYGLLRQWLAPVPVVAVVVAMVAVLAGGVLLNLVLASVNLVPQTSLLPTLLYVAAASATVHTLTPALLVNLAVIASLNCLMLHGSTMSVPIERICSATALIGIATMFSVPAMALLVAYLLVAANHRLYGWRDWAALLLGFMAPYVILLLVLMFAGDMQAWWHTTTEGLGNIGLGIGDSTPIRMAANIVLAAIMMAALVAQVGQMGEKTTAWQKNATTVILFVVGGVGMMLYGPTLPIDTTLFAVPFALCGTHLLLPQRQPTPMRGKKRRQWVRDALLMLTVMTAVIC